jgi:hypothetical protein
MDEQRIGDRNTGRHDSSHGCDCGYGCCRCDCGYGCCRGSGSCFYFCSFVSVVSTYETDLAVLRREDFWLIVAFRGSEDETEIHSG